MRKTSLFINRLWGLVLLLLLVTACKNKPTPLVLNSKPLVFLNNDGLQQVKVQIREDNPYYVQALEKVVQEADNYLLMPANPVVHKSILPPSGNLHDYLSLAPYWWPNPNSRDSLPWIRRDGEVNPMTRGDNTDKQRLFNLKNAIHHLTVAFYYTDEQKYAKKVVDLLKIWFVDVETKMNPNINFGQGIPGKNNGRPFGIIEWRDLIENTITALQMLKQKSTLPEVVETEIQVWLNQYLDWLLNSELGQLEGTRKNNHANWYDYQVISISIYLGRTKTAKRWAEAAKVNRISTQIEVDGSQPHELARTKSLSYSAMNLKAMILVADLAQKVDVDLLYYTSKDGKSLLKAVEYLTPYAKKEKEWTYPQISEDGWQKTVDQNVLPLFSIISSIYGKPIFEDEQLMKQKLKALDRLQYPPLLYE